MFVLYCVNMPFTMREGANKNGRPGRPDNAVSNTNDVAIGAVRRLATEPQPPTLTTERRPDGTRNGMDRRTEEPALEEDSPKGSTSDAGGHQLDFTSRRRRTTWLRVTCAIGYATNRDGWSREGGCHGWIRVNRPVRTQLEPSRTMRTDPHVNAPALRELDR